MKYDNKGFNNRIIVRESEFNNAKIIADFEATLENIKQFCIEHKIKKTDDEMNGFVNKIFNSSSAFMRRKEPTSGYIFYLQLDPKYVQWAKENSIKQSDENSEDAIESA